MVVRKNKTILLCYALILVSATSMAVGIFDKSVTGPLDEGHVVSLSEAHDAKIAEQMLVEARLSGSVMVDVPNFSEDDVAEALASPVDRDGILPVSSDARLAIALQQLTTAYDTNPESLIEEVWALALDLGRQEEAILALGPYLSHGVVSVSDLTRTALSSLAASRAPADQRLSTIAGPPVNDRYLQALLGKAMPGDDPVTQREAVGELGTYASPAALQALESVLYQGGSANIQVQAIQSLATIASMGFERRHVRQVLQSVAASGSAEVAGAANQSLADMTSFVDAASTDTP